MRASLAGGLSSFSFVRAEEGLPCVPNKRYAGREHSERFTCCSQWEKLKLFSGPSQHTKKVNTYIYLYLFFTIAILSRKLLIYSKEIRSRSPDCLQIMTLVISIRSVATRMHVYCTWTILVLMLVER